MGYHGYERNTTPQIDTYADESSTFLNAFSHVGGTRFSFPGILSGVTPMMYGGRERISEVQTLISEVFNDAGYRTGGFHSNLYVSGKFGYDRGWDEFYDSAPDESATSKLRKWAKTNLDGTLLSLLRRGYDFLESSQGINVGSYHVPADEITDRAIQFIEESDDETPTFVWAHYMDVHHPFLPPEEYQRKFRDEPVSDDESIQLRRKYIEEPEAVTPEEHQTLSTSTMRRYGSTTRRSVVSRTPSSQRGERLLMALTDSRPVFSTVCGGARQLGDYIEPSR